MKGVIGNGLNLIPRGGGGVVLGHPRHRRSRLDVLHEGFLRFFSKISEFRDLSASDGEFAAMMYDRVENREKRDERVQVVVEEFLGGGKGGVERAERTSVDPEFVQDAEMAGKVRMSRVITRMLGRVELEGPVRNLRTSCSQREEGET